MLLGLVCSRVVVKVIIVLVLVRRVPLTKRLEVVQGFLPGGHGLSGLHKSTGILLGELFVLLHIERLVQVSDQNLFLQLSCLA